MGKLDDLVRTMVEQVVNDAGKKNIEDTYTEFMERRISENPLLDPDFQDDYIDHCMESVGLVFCINCQKFIDDERHDIKHIFAHNAREIREKSVLERMAGNITESNDAF